MSKNVKDELDTRIVNLKKAINSKDISDEDVKKVYEELKTLYSLKQEDTATYGVERKVKDWTPIITSAIGFAGIISILTFERFDVITSKALNVATRMLK